MNTTDLSVSLLEQMTNKKIVSERMVSYLIKSDNVSLKIRLIPYLISFSERHGH